MSIPGQVSFSTKFKVGLNHYFGVWQLFLKFFLDDFFYFDCTEIFYEQVTIYRLVLLSLASWVGQRSILPFQSQEDDVQKAPGIRMLFIYSELCSSTDGIRKENRPNYTLSLLLKLWFGKSLFEFYNTHVHTYNENPCAKHKTRKQIHTELYKVRWCLQVLKEYNANKMAQWVKVFTVTWVQLLGLSWWEERTESCKLSSAHRYAQHVTHTF